MKLLEFEDKTINCDKIIFFKKKGYVTIIYFSDIYGKVGHYLHDNEASNHWKNLHLTNKIELPINAKELQEFLLSDEKFLKL